MIMLSLHFFIGLHRFPLLPLAAHCSVISPKRKATEKSGHDGRSVRRAHFIGVPATLSGVDNDAAPQGENKQLYLPFV